MWSRIELKERAKHNIAAFFWPSVLVAFILNLISSDGGTSGRGSNHGQSSNVVENFVSNSFAGRWVLFLLSLAVVVIIIAAVFGIVINIFLLNPLKVGCKKFFLEASYGAGKLNQMSYGFQSNYGNIVKAMFLHDLFIFLWSLLLVIPGIIKSYEYRMIPYLLCENPNLTFEEAKSRSQQMMDGEKWNAFVLDLSFFLWHLLSAISFGLVGIFYVNPYVAYTDVELFKVLSSKSNGYGYDNMGYNPYQF